MRLAQLPALASLFSVDVNFEGTGTGTGIGAGRTDVPNVPGLREWGRFRTREAEGLNASLRESDPPEYQEALKIYFEELGKSQPAGAKK